MVHDPDPVRERGGLVHVVRRQEERDAAVAQLAEAVPDEQPRGRVEAGRVGSSRKSTSGACISARAIITRCDWPPENMSGFCLARSSSPNCSSSSSARRVALARRDAVVGGVEDQVVADRERAVEVAALRDDRERAARAHRVGDDVDAGDRGRAASSAARVVVSTPTVVVFPAPFGPSRPKTSPRSALNETPSTALTGDFG